MIDVDTGIGVGLNALSECVGGGVETSVVQFDGAECDIHCPPFYLSRSRTHVGPQSMFQGHMA